MGVLEQASAILLDMEQKLLDMEKRFTRLGKPRTKKNKKEVTVAKKTEEKKVKVPEDGPRITDDVLRLSGCLSCILSKRHKDEVTGQVLRVQCRAGVVFHPRHFDKDGKEFKFNAVVMDEKGELSLTGHQEALQNAIQMAEVKDGRQRAENMELIRFMLSVLPPSDRFANQLAHELEVSRGRKYRNRFYASGMSREEVEEFVRISMADFHRLGIYPARVEKFGEDEWFSSEKTDSEEQRIVARLDRMGAVKKVGVITGSHLGCQLRVPKPVNFKTGWPMQWNKHPYWDQIMQHKRAVFTITKEVRDKDGEFVKVPILDEAEARAECERAGEIYSHREKRKPYRHYSVWRKWFKWGAFDSWMHGTDEELDSPEFPEGKPLLAESTKAKFRAAIDHGSICFYDDREIVYQLLDGSW